MKTGDVVEGRYRIIKTLGEGGMGTVFLAEHALIKRRVAIKILHPELATDSNVIERFMNEARAAGTLGHPNIVESTDMGFTHHHVPYIVFEYLEGTLLTDEIYRVGGLPVRRACRIAQQIASALHAAHNASIVHRDLKSDNVFLTDKDDALDHVKVLDFGISRFLELDERQRNMIMGTPEFMAPEQITAPDSVDRRADIYALGVILYEMLTARRPFSNEDDPRALLQRIVHEAPPPLMRPEVPEGLQKLILTKLLAKHPASRYQSMADIEAALDGYVTRGDGTPVPRKRTGPVAKVTDDFALESTKLGVEAAPARPAKSLNTPWPVGHVDTIDHPVTGKRAPLPSKKSYALYGIAGAGIVVGALGLMFGLKGNKDDAPPPVAATPAPAPAPAAAMPAAREPQKIEIQLEADNPNARVVFRRRLATSPTTIQITASDIVELVEVSAPGYKTQRYWLTFDRPTHLKAHLVKGDGIVEATEEETLVALGELASTKPAKQEVAKPQVAAVEPTPAEPTKVEPVKAEPTKVEPVKVVATPKTTPTETARPTPRKIGHGSDTVEPVHPAKSDAIATLEPTKTEPAKAEPTKAEPTMPEPTKAEPAKTDPTLPDAAKTEPALPDPARTKPAIDMATVSSVVGSHRPEVLKCFSDGKKKSPTLKGTLNLQLQVDTSGKVHRVQVQSTLNAPLVAACVVKSANAWKFPARAGGGDLATVNYPFTVN